MLDTAAADLARRTIRPKLQKLLNELRGELDRIAGSLKSVLV
jgi:hypothetical protein